MLSRFYKLDDNTVVDTESTTTMTGNANEIIQILEGLELEVKLSMEDKKDKFIFEIEELMNSFPGGVGLMPEGQGEGGVTSATWKQVVDMGYLPSMKPYIGE